MMRNKYQLLARPPIKEAVLQLLISPSMSYKPELLKTFIKAESATYPTCMPQNETLIQLMIGEDGQQAGVKNKGVSGYKISSDDGLNIVQVFKDRLAISRLDSYSSWDDLVMEAQRVWGVYTSIFKPKSVKGVSVRYINHFLLPPDMKSFEDYLESTPRIPSKLPQELASFVTSYKMPDPETGAIANIQLIFQGAQYEKDSKELQLPIVLDTDVMKNFAVELDDCDAIWNSFSQLHDLKNEIFFNIVKEKTMEMFR